MQKVVEVAAKEEDKVVTLGEENKNIGKYHVNLVCEDGTKKEE